MAPLLVAFLVGLVAALALGAGALYAFDQQYTGRILPGVTVGGIDLSGLTPDEAPSRRSARRSARSPKGGPSSSGGDAEQVDRLRRRSAAARISRRMVAEAMAVGRRARPSSGSSPTPGPRSAASTSSRGSRSTRRASRATSRSHAGAVADQPIDASVDARRRTASRSSTGVDGTRRRPDRADRAADGRAGLRRRPERDPRRRSSSGTSSREVTTAEADRGQGRRGADRRRRRRSSTGNETLDDPGRDRPHLDHVRDDRGRRLRARDRPRPSSRRPSTALAKKIDPTPMNATFTSSGSKVTGVIAGQERPQARHGRRPPSQVTALLATRADGTARTPRSRRP